MSDYRFILEPYKGMKTRFTCPSCQKRKEFTRYIDKKTGDYLPYDYGMCNKKNKCNYHLNPYTAGYHKEVWKAENGKAWNVMPERNRVYKKAIKTKPVFIPKPIFEGSLKNYQNNNFVQYLVNTFGVDKANNLVNRFYIGTSCYWDAPATVFWMIDEFNRIRSGHVIWFNEDGYTRKITFENGDKRRYNSWVHTALKSYYEKRGQQLPLWLIDYCQSENPKMPCLFGLPQLKSESRNKPIAITEAPKTAIIASCYFPQFIWLAVGGLDMLNEQRLKVLEGRNITLFPDKGGFKKWKKKAVKLSHLAKFTVSELLERENAAKGTDIADYLIGNFTEEATKPEKKVVKSLDSLRSKKSNDNAYFISDNW